MTQRRIDQEIVRATDELKADVVLTHRIVTGDENTVIEVSPGNAVRSPKKMVEDTYQETKVEIEERLGSLEAAVDEATEQARQSEQSRQASDDSATSASASEEEAARSESSARASKDAAEVSATEAASSESKAKASETAATGSALEAAESESSALASSNAAASSATAAADSESNAQASETAAADSESQAKASETAAKDSETAAATSETEAKASAASSKASELNASESEQAAAGSASAAQASEEQADEHRQSAAGSDESARSARDAAISARDTSIEAKDETLTARDLAWQWATEAEDTPVQDNEFSALHWAKVAERFAGTITNGMYFAGSWDLADGFPPEPDGPGVPWYRITSNDISAVMPVSAELEKIAGESNKGDQLIWDPIQKEWFVIDTSDEVWLVNGKKGNVVLNAEDVSALPDTGGRLSGDLRIPDKGKGIYLTDEVVVRSGGGSDGLLLLGGSEAVEARFQMERLTLTNDFNQRGHSVYHEGFRPSPADIGALGDTGNQELTGAIYPKVSEGSADDEPASWSDGYSLSAATGSAGYAAYGTLINSRTGAGRSLQILGYPDSGTPKLRFRVADPDDGSWLPQAEIYSSQNKPTATDVGLGNLTNNRQVILNGNNRIQNASSFIIDGNETAGGEDNVRGVVRITLSEDDSFGSKGTVFFQAGDAQSVNTASNGAMVFGGYWGGFLHEANFKLLDANKLTVQISGSSTKHSVYHEGNIPHASTSTVGISKLNDSTNSSSKDEAATANAVKQINEKISLSGTPIGACMMWPGSSAPSGWVEARGQSTSSMSQAIKDLYGNNLPDMRGEFPRGWDNGRKVDDGRSRLSGQGELVKAHNHSASFNGESVGGHTHTRGSMNITGEIRSQHNNNRTSFTGQSGAFLSGGTNRPRPSDVRDGGGSFPSIVKFDASESWSGATSSSGGHTPSGSVTVNNSSGSETRPRNVAWMFIILIGQ